MQRRLNFWLAGSRYGCWGGRWTGGFIIGAKRRCCRIDRLDLVAAAPTIDLVLSV